MNLQEKTQLIKEIYVLTHQLEHRTISLYETARSKKRIHEIFALCDEPIFQKQLLEYKALTEPTIAAQQFAKQTPFSRTFRGYFQNSDALEDGLYQHPEMGWAFLHQAGHWQIWMIPAPSRTALISEWGKFADCYDWLLKQQQLYQCLETDQEHQQRISEQNQTRVNKRLGQKLEALHTDNQTQVQVHSINMQEHTNTQVSDCIQNVNLPSAEQNSDVKLESTNCTLTSSLPIQEASEQVVAKSHHAQTHTSNIDSIQIGQFTASVQQIPLLQHDSVVLFELLIHEQPEINLHIDLLIHATTLEHWDERPVYVAEQINVEGKFIKYLMLLGAESQMEAIRLAQLFTQQHQHDVASIKTLSITLMSQILFKPHELYQHYQLAENIWHKADYFPFIPATLLHTQKFIQFEEPEAQFSTPILLLQERQKLRLIHGDQRLALSRTEQAYPYLILSRQQGLNWQTIQTVINQLPQPIDVQQLYQALKLYIED